MQLDLTVLTKTKKPAIADCTHMVAEALSTHVSIILT
jgi:hypothetical protein